MLTSVLPREKCIFFFERLDEIEGSEELCEEVTERIVNLREILSFSEKKPDKERNLKTILNCKKYLKGYIKFPKKTSQNAHINCCKILGLHSIFPRSESNCASISVLEILSKQYAL